MIMVPMNQSDNMFPGLHGLKRKKFEEITQIGQLVGNGCKGVDEGNLRLFEEMGTQESLN